MNTFWLLLLIFVSSNVKGAKILGIFHVTAPSHYILGSSLMRGLADKGHDVTVISPYGEKDASKNYKDIILTGFIEEMTAHVKKDNKFDRFSSIPIPILTMFLNKMGYKMTEMTLQHANVQELLRSNETFDLVITEQFMNDAFKAIALHYKSSLIVLSTVGANPWVNNLVANPGPPSYIPEFMGSLPVKMNFWQRLRNTYIYLTSQLYTYLIALPQHKSLAQQYFPDVDVSQIETSVDLVLLNSHPSISQPTPLVPNMVEIGGFHVKPPRKLPKDLQQFLDSAQNGFVYFSMGSNLRSADLSPEKRDAFLNVFRRLNLKVLWKWEEDVLPDQPDNVKLVKWAPQQDVLAHPNIKLFITHGGLLSATETIYHGVPILAIPVMGDQAANAQNAVQDGFGLSIPFAELAEELLEEKIKQLLENPKYQKVAKIKSEIFHDRQVKPLDQAIYWVEYIIRHKGAPHLRVEGIHLPWYKYHLLDVFVFVVVVVSVVAWAGWKITLLTFRALLSLGKSDKNQKLKKN